MTITLRSSGRIVLTSTQAGMSAAELGVALAFSTHSLSCQTTPASGPTTCLNQLAKGSLGNSASIAEARILCMSATARFSKSDNDCFSATGRVCGLLFKNENHAITIVTAAINFMGEP